MRTTSFAIAALSLLFAACGGGTTTTGPTAPPAESSFLTGTWQGPLTIHREGLPDSTGMSTWTLALVPNTNGTTFTTTLTSQNAYIPVTTTLSTAIVPAQPGGHITTAGFYPSPRGCQGSLLSAGTAQVDRIEATFEGSDCVPSVGPVAFTGSVSLTKSR
jgi:hypothetical protein